MTREYGDVQKLAEPRNSARLILSEGRRDSRAESPQEVTQGVERASAEGGLQWQGKGDDSVRRPCVRRMSFSVAGEKRAEDGGRTETGTMGTMERRREGGFCARRCLSSIDRLGRCWAGTVGLQVKAR